MTLKAAAKVWDNSSESLLQVESRIHDGVSGEAALHARADQYMSQAFRMLPNDLPANAAIAEIGSGVGYMMQSVARRLPAASIRGVDISERMIELATQRTGMEVLRYDGVHVPIEDDSMDFVYSISAIQHIPKPFVYNLFFEVKRILRTGRFAVFHFLAFHHLQTMENGYWRKEIDRQIEEHDDEHWGFYYSEEELKRVLVDGTGFRYVKVNAQLGSHAMVCFGNV